MEVTKRHARLLYTRLQHLQQDSVFSEVNVTIGNWNPLKVRSTWCPDTKIMRFTWVHSLHISIKNVYGCINSHKRRARQFLERIMEKKVSWPGFVLAMDPWLKTRTAVEKKLTLARGWNRLNTAFITCFWLSSCFCLKKASWYTWKIFQDVYHSEHHIWRRGTARYGLTQHLNFRSCWYSLETLI